MGGKPVKCCSRGADVPGHFGEGEETISVRRGRTPLGV